MEALTINEAAETTGWSARMLRYVEQAGLVTPDRSPSATGSTAPRSCSGCARSRNCWRGSTSSLSDVAFAARLDGRPRAARAVQGWLSAQARRPEDVAAEDWLRFEQDKHERLLAAVDRRVADRRPPERATQALTDIEQQPGETNMSTTAAEDRLQGRRSVAGRVRPQGDPAGRARDAGPDGDPARVRRQPAAEGRADHRLAAHDDPDRGADRDAGGARRRGALGVLQHLLDPGSRGRGGRRRPRRHPRGPAGRAGVRLEGRDARGVLVVHRAGADVAGRATART